MRRKGPFGPGDLESLDSLYRKAHGVVAMEDVWRGNHRPDVIAVRHDVDDNSGSFQAAVKLARWECARGHRSTYFLLHTARYWGAHYFARGVEQIALHGHEIGIHTNALAEALRTGDDPNDILAGAIAMLRSFGIPVNGIVAHGDEACRKFGFVNDEQFTECERPDYGAPDRLIGGRLKLEPVSYRQFGIRYEANRLGRSHYASDSGGTWFEPWETTLEEFERGQGQLHILQHPDWWTEAF